MFEERAFQSNRRTFAASRIMWDWVYEHAHFYHHYVLRMWHNLGPTGYASVLTFVGVFGFLAMRGKKRH
jgi:hypothetical protein